MILAENRWFLEELSSILGLAIDRATESWLIFLIDVTHNRRLFKQLSISDSDC